MQLVSTFPFIGVGAFSLPTLAAPLSKEPTCLKTFCERVNTSKLSENAKWHLRRAAGVWIRYKKVWRTTTVRPTHDEVEEINESGLGYARYYFAPHPANGKFMHFLEITFV